MKPPTIQSGKHRIRYRQIPFVGRFFFVDIKDDSGKWDKEFMKIRSFHYKCDLPLQKVFDFLQTVYVVNWNINGKLYIRLVTFINEVAKYDNYLDDKE